MTGREEQSSDAKAAALVPELGQLVSVHPSANSPVKLALKVAVAALTAALAFASAYAILVYTSSDPDDMTNRGFRAASIFGIFAALVGLVALAILILAVKGLIRREGRDWLAAYERGFARSVGAKVTATPWSEVSRVDFKVHPNGYVDCRLALADQSVFEVRKQFQNPNSFATTVAQLLPEYRGKSFPPPRSGIRQWGPNVFYFVFFGLLALFFVWDVLLTPNKPGL